ncbi:MAG: DUF2723 domain-containing protein [Elusimicrobiota bacterium]
MSRTSSIVVGLVVFLLYLSYPSRFHNFDGVACAIAVELGEPRYLVHGNHLVYGLAGWAFHGLLNSVGIRLSALWALQVLDSLAGAAAVGVFHATLLAAGLVPGAALLAAAGLALSFGFWFWSLEAQVYALGALLLALSLREMLRERPSPYRLALWHGLSMLSHGANVLLAPVVVANLWRAHEDKRRATSLYLVSAAALVIVSYGAAVVWLVRPRSLEELRVWLLGSAALTADRSFSWHGTRFLESLPVWLGMSLKTLSPAPWLGWVPWACGLWALFKRPEARLRLVLSAWLWLGCYALLFTRWEPFTMAYRMSDMLPLWLLAGVFAERIWSSRHGKAACLVFALLLGAVNFGAGILPASRAQGNVPLQRALWIRDSTPEDAWVASYGIFDVYIPYFAHRRPLNLRYFKGRREALAGRLWEILESGSPVFVTSSVLREADTSPSLLNLSEVSRRHGDVLYRIQGLAE